MTDSGEIRPKWLTVAQLRRVLADLPDDYELICADTQNLVAYKPTSGQAEYAGFIDFLHEGEWCEE